jgi:hypothetical protein
MTKKSIDRTGTGYKSHLSKGGVRQTSHTNAYESRHGLHSCHSEGSTDDLIAPGRQEQLRKRAKVRGAVGAAIQAIEEHVKMAKKDSAELAAQ